MLLPLLPPPQDCMLKPLGTRHRPQAQHATKGALGLDRDGARKPRTHRPGWAGARGAPCLHPPPAQMRAQDGKQLSARVRTETHELPPLWCPWDSDSRSQF